MMTVIYAVAWFVAAVFVVVVLGVGLTCTNQVQNSAFARLTRIGMLRFACGICFLLGCPIVGSACFGYLKETWPLIWSDPKMFELNLVMVPFLIFYSLALTIFPVLVAHSCFTWRPPTSVPAAPSP